MQYQIILARRHNFQCVNAMTSHLEQLDYLTKEISNSFPGNEALISQLTTLITACPPTFTYINDPYTPRVTASLVNTLISSLSAVDATFFDDDVTPIIASAQVNAIACFTSRLFYDTTFNCLAKWRPRWEDGCENWPGAVNGLSSGGAGLSSPLKGGGEASLLNTAKAVRMVLVVDRAERLTESLPELLVPLTRLAELSKVDIHTIFISQSPWEDVKPSTGTAIDPFHLSVYPPLKEDTLRILTSRFPTDGDLAAMPHAYHPAFAELYAQYVSALFSTCSPFTRDPYELAYVAAAQWPSFIAPVLDAQKGATEFHPIPEDVRLRLLRVFLPSFAAALEALLPRRMHATAWSRMSDMADGVRIDEKNSEVTTCSLTTLQKYVLLAAFLASSNPPKTDARMFARGHEMRSKRRRGGGVRKTPQRNTKGALAKVGRGSFLVLSHHVP
ncbi:origin recognition complex subunit 5 C-terminus-domain-containing protein [Multifurca ochricompacta]|uniref:Origin recognition complex subunit 5 C-terminus-domain-containing protein n=1 Tax=Multifurca ochricompacta TaxID=376703 RepID=A0AAD4M5J6_9AGAM|nr:origin recognition complex subunit 5 C-terminus-domain-containing protein [Multifurca ochricompacta]